MTSDHPGEILETVSEESSVQEPSLTADGSVSQRAHASVLPETAPDRGNSGSIGLKSGETSVRAKSGPRRRRKGLNPRAVPFAIRAKRPIAGGRARTGELSLYQILRVSRLGLPLPEAAAVLGVVQSTLAELLESRPRYAEAYRRGLALAAADLRRSIRRQYLGSPAKYDAEGNEIRKERAPHPIVTIFAAKNMLGWADRSIIEERWGGNPANIPTAELLRLADRARAVLAGAPAASPNEEGLTIQGRARLVAAEASREGLEPAFERSPDPTPQMPKPNPPSNSHPPQPPSPSPQSQATKRQSQSRTRSQGAEKPKTARKPRAQTRDTLKLTWTPTSVAPPGPRKTAAEALLERKLALEKEKP